MSTGPQIRLGTTSFIYRAGWADNVHRLGPRVDDVELLFFEPGHDNRPSPEEVRRLADLGSEHHLTYCVHTPLSLQLAHPDPTERQRSVDEVLALAEHCQPFRPWAYVVHVYWGQHEHDPQPPPDRARWCAEAEASLRALREGLPEGVAVCVESLDYDLRRLQPALEGADVDVALDVGHLWRDHQPLEPLLSALGPRVRIVQCHGTDPHDRDHRGLAHVDDAQGRSLFKLLVDISFGGVVTLEVFRERDFEQSWPILERWAGAHR